MLVGATTQAEFLKVLRPRSPKWNHQFFRATPAPEFVGPGLDGSKWHFNAGCVDGRRAHGLNDLGRLIVTDLVLQLHFEVRELRFCGMEIVAPLFQNPRSSFQNCFIKAAREGMPSILMDQGEDSAPGP